MKHVLAIFAITVPATMSHADVAVFFDGQRDAWFDAVGGEQNVSTIDFVGFPSDFQITDEYSYLGVTFSGSNFILGPDPAFFPDDEWGLITVFGNDLYFDEPINWIAADFRGDIKIELYTAGQLFYSSPLLSGPGLQLHFGGLFSDKAFDQARILDPFDEFAVLDNIHFGPPIPAPSAFIPMMLAFGLPRRRRRD